MKNYWVKDIAKTTFVDNMTTALNLTTDQVSSVNSLITNSTMKYYIVFENFKLKTFLTYDGNKCTMMSEFQLSSSGYNSTDDKNQHILVGKHPDSEEILGTTIFTEDFATGSLLTGTATVNGFNFDTTSITLEVIPPAGSTEPPPPILTSICCLACAYVHSQLGLEYLNCMCCGFGCEFSCGIPSL